MAKFKASCFRSNLFYDVRFKDSLEDPFEELRDFVVEALGKDWEVNRTVSGGFVLYCFMLCKIDIFFQICGCVKIQNSFIAIT